MAEGRSRIDGRAELSFEPTVNVFGSFVSGEAGEKARIGPPGWKSAAGRPALLVSLFAGSFLCSSSFSPGIGAWERNNFSTLSRECRELGHEDTPPWNRGERRRERLRYIYSIFDPRNSPVFHGMFSGARIMEIIRIREERPSLLRTCDTAHRFLCSTFSTLFLSTHSNISRILSYSRDPIIYLKAHFRASFFVRLNIRWIRLCAA